MFFNNFDTDMLQNFPNYFVSLFIFHNVKVATIAHELISKMFNDTEQSDQGSS